MIDESQFYCTKCGRRGIDIPRPGRKREAGHLKKIYCLYCKQEVNHVEVKPCTKYDLNEFMLEFDYGNFDDEGNRILEFGKFKQKLNKEGLLL